MTKARDDMKRNRRLLWTVENNDAYAEYRERLNELKAEEEK